MWLPMMPGDSREAAEAEAHDFVDRRVDHVWDPNRELADLFSRPLRLSATAWDAYLLYAPGVTWEAEEPPEPGFWMHQLPAQWGADPALLLSPARIAREVLAVLGGGDEPASPDLALVLHDKGLATVVRGRAGADCPS